MSTVRTDPPRPGAWRRRSRAGTVALTTAALLVVAGCAPDTDGASDGVDPATAAGLAVPPLDLDDAPATVADHYRFVDAHRDVTDRVPCYCGCDRSIGHRNLTDCFVRSDDRGWDAHAAGCTVCTDESATVRRLLGNGVEPNDVRAAIVDEFGYLAPAT